MIEKKTVTMGEHLERAKEVITRVQHLTRSLAIVGEPNDPAEMVECLWRVYFLAEAIVEGGGLKEHTGLAAAQATYEIAYTAHLASQMVAATPEENEKYQKHLRSRLNISNGIKEVLAKAEEES
mgnify:CR=1 FL=1